MATKSDFIVQAGLKVNANATFMNTIKVGSSFMNATTISIAGGTSVNATHVTAIASNALQLNGVDGPNYQGKANTYYIGTTALTLNRASAAQTLTGVNIDGNAATATNGLTTGNFGNYAVPITGGTMSGKLIAYALGVGGMSNNAVEAWPIATASTTYQGGIMVQSAGAGAAFMTFHKPGIYASYFGLDVDNQFAVGGWSAGNGLAYFKCRGLGVGVNQAAINEGVIAATGNIVAYYSDKRLKENIEVIPDALNKVSKISGVTFNSNDLAATFGYKDKSRQVGVIAQEIKEVLPEVVVRAPFDTELRGEEVVSKSGEEYMTVQYEKIVPLLIEAIKELKARVEELENK